MNDIHIRGMHAGDTEELLGLNESNLPHVSSISHADIESFQRQACYFRIAEAGGKIAGFLLAFDPEADYGSPNFLWFKERYPSFVYIDRIIIAPHARRKGIATCLYTDLEHFAGGMGIPLMTCEYNILPKNEESRLFHLNYGFFEAGTQKTTGGRKTVSLQVRQVNGHC
jgi:predicted GNAT superfamily acetyltransferase